MKWFIGTITLVLLLAPETFARQQSKPPRATAPGTLSREQSLLARITVYWASGGRGSDRYTRRHKCATGMRLRQGHCAVDPKKIPYGSHVIFPDGTRLAAVDTGTAVKNRKAARKLGRTIHERNAVVVDRFFETKRQALAWASKNPYFMTVRVIPPGRAALPNNQVSRQEPIRTVATKIVKNSGSGGGGGIAYSSTIVKNPMNKLGR